MTSLTEKEPTSRGGRGARRRILAAAAELFYFDGINATGVDLIANRASVSKRTLYQHFPSKATLVEEYLRQLRQQGGAGEEASAPTPDTTPRARLLALFELTDAGAGRMRGCPFHNAAVEAAGAMPGVEMLGNQIALLYEGAAAMSTSMNDPAPWAQARATAEALIDLATTCAA